MTEGYIAPKKAVPKKKAAPLKVIRHWSQCTVLSREVANSLNELSKSGYQIFSVNQSVSIGGSYEIIYYIENTVPAEE